MYVCKLVLYVSQMNSIADFKYFYHKKNVYSLTNHPWRVM